MKTKYEMPALTNDEREELIERMVGRLEYLKTIANRAPRREVLSLQIALASLTTKQVPNPIDLSACKKVWYEHDDLSHEIICIPVKEIKKAIRAAGGRVKS